MHFFDNKDGVDYPGEEGNQYEIDVYGELAFEYEDAEKLTNTYD